MVAKSKFVLSFFIFFLISQLALAQMPASDVPSSFSVVEGCWTQVLSDPCKKVVTSQSDLAEVRRFYSSFISCTDYASLRNFKSIANSSAVPEKYRDFAKKINDDYFPNAIRDCINQKNGVSAASTPSMAPVATTAAAVTTTAATAAGQQGVQQLQATNQLLQNMDAAARRDTAGVRAANTPAANQNNNSSSEATLTPDSVATSEPAQPVQRNVTSAGVPAALAPTQTSQQGAASTAGHFNNDDDNDFGSDGGQHFFRPPQSKSQGTGSSPSSVVPENSNSAAATAETAIAQGYMGPTSSTAVNTTIEQARSQETANLNAAISAGIISESDKAAIQNLGGPLNEKAIKALESTVEALAKAEQVATSGSSNLSASIKPQIEAYKKAAESCSSAAARAEMVCVEESSPAIKAVMNIFSTSLPLLQAATGANNACSTAAKTMGNINKGILLATAVCGGFKTMCTLTCTGVEKALTAIRETVIAARTRIIAAAETNMKSEIFNTCKDMATAGMCSAAIESKYSKIPPALTQAMTLFNKAWTFETNSPKDKLSLNYKIAMCDRFSETIARTMSGLISMMQSRAQAKQCAALTAANNQANKCEDPTSAATKECLCKRPDLAETSECAPLKVGGSGNCSGAQVKDSAGTCVSLAELCKNEPSNAACAGLGAKDVGAISPGMQKMTGGRTPATTPTSANLGGLGMGADGSGKDGSSAPLAAMKGAGGSMGAGGGLGGGVGGGAGSGAAGDGHGSAAGGGKGASLDSTGGGGGGGLGGLSGLNWDREKNKEDALAKLNEEREKARLSGADVLKNNGITGSTGRTLWEKVSTRYRESKTTLIGE